MKIGRSMGTREVSSRGRIAKRPLAIIVAVMLLLSSVVPTMALANSSNGGG
ncbi:MAG: hypothetical protein LBN34_03185 [Clostridiales Family XIII bacterium]|nr:hypothetical protein [Clostridiales Family XIII bacterium]